MNPEIIILWNKAKRAFNLIRYLEIRKAARYDVKRHSGWEFY